MRSSSSAEKDKRQLQRGPSDPPRAKAKATPVSQEQGEESEHELMAASTDEDRFDMKTLIQLMKRVDKRTARMEQLHKEVETFKREIKEEVSGIRAEVNSALSATQTKLQETTTLVQAIDQRVAKLESLPPSSSTTPPMPSAFHRSSSQASAAPTSTVRTVPPNELVITGFDREELRSVRSQVAEKLLKELPVNGQHFRINPKFLHSNLCFLVLKDSTPTAVLNSVLEECRMWSNSGQGSIEHDGKQYKVTIRRPVPPARLRRNAILNQAMQYVEKHGKDIKEEIAICWQTGVLKHGKEVIFGCDYEGGKAYYAPLLQLGISKEALSQVLDSPAPSKGTRL